MRTPWIILLVLCLVVSGCKLMGLEQVSDSTKRIETDSYSVLPPSGKGWYVERKPNETLLFHKETEDPRHVIFGTIVHTEKKFDSVQALYASWEQTAAQKIEERTAEAPQLKLYQDTSLEYDAVRGEYETITPGVEGNPETGWITNGVFISTIHPVTKCRFDVLFQQKRPPTVKLLPVMDDLERLFHSLEFKGSE